MKDSQDGSRDGAQQVLMYGIGAQKAGTSWLQSTLENRDGVFLQKPKELHYWDTIRAPYLRHFRLKAQERLRVPDPEAPLRRRLSRSGAPRCGHASPWPSAMAPSTDPRPTIMPIICPIWGQGAPMPG